jgi:hypothetical protein
VEFANFANKSAVLLLAMREFHAFCVKFSRIGFVFEITSFEETAAEAANYVLVVLVLHTFSIVLRLCPAFARKIVKIFQCQTMLPLRSFCFPDNQKFKTQNYLPTLL